MPIAIQLLNDYTWPGNERELENAIERALVLAREGIITEQDIELRSPGARSSGKDWPALAPLEIGWQANVAALEKAMVERALLAAGGNKSRAAEMLGIHRRLIYEKMRQYGLE